MKGEKDYKQKRIKQLKQTKVRNENKQTSKKKHK